MLFRVNGIVGLKFCYVVCVNLVLCRCVVWVRCWIVDVLCKVNKFVFSWLSWLKVFFILVWWCLINFVLIIWVSVFLCVSFLVVVEVLKLFVIWVSLFIVLFSCWMYCCENFGNCDSFVVLFSLIINVNVWIMLFLYEKRWIIVCFYFDFYVFFGCGCFV